MFNKLVMTAPGMNQHHSVWKHSNAQTTMVNTIPIYKSHPLLNLVNLFNADPFSSVVCDGWVARLISALKQLMFVDKTNIVSIET